MKRLALIFALVALPILASVRIPPKGAVLLATKNAVQSQPWYVSPNLFFTWNKMTDGWVTGYYITDQSNQFTTTNNSITISNIALGVFHNITVAPTAAFDGSRFFPTSFISSATFDARLNTLTIARTNSFNMVMFGCFPTNTYTVLYSSDLKSWQPLYPPITPSMPGLLRVFDPSSVSERFYRLSVK